MKQASRPTLPSASPQQFRGWPAAAVFLLTFVVVVVAYFPSLRGDFLWDDAGHVTNPALQSPAGLLRIWFEPGATQQYYPLLHSAFWLEHQIWGDAPLGYRLINILWHALSACLLVVILRRLKVPGALLAGLVFALHPVCVESVAWIAEQKNTLSTVFYLAAAQAWLRYEDDRRPSRYAIALLWFVAALLTKTVTATLPAALLVVAWWRSGRISWRQQARPLLPWLLLGALAGLGTAWFESAQIGATGDDFALSVVERGLLAGRVVWFYLGKLLWPSELTFFYPRWTIDAASVAQWLFPLATLLVLAGLCWWRKRHRAPLAAALLFGGSLFPVLGFVNVYPFVFSYVADHFQYLASIGMISFLTAAASIGFARMAWPRWTGPAAATGLLLVLGGLTWHQSGMYRDVFTLYGTTLERNPTSWAAHLNLGTALDEAGNPDQALPHLQKALELKPGYPETLNSLGNVLNHLGRSAEARPFLEEALRIQPRFASAHNTLGAALMALGLAEEGIAHFRQAVAIDPGLALAQVNIGWALANQKRFSEAFTQFEATHRRWPDMADLEFKWGLALTMSGQVNEALPHLRRASGLQSENPEMHFILALALVDTGRQAEAVEQLEEVLSLQPNHQRALELLSRIPHRGY